MKKVSVSERLPKESGYYMVWYRDGRRNANEWYVPSSKQAERYWNEHIAHWLDESADIAPVDVKRLAEDIAHMVTKIGSDTGDIEEAAAMIEAVVRDREEQIVEAYRLFRNSIAGLDSKSYEITTKERLDKFTSKP